jgi:glc operon protein GlcG
MANFDGPHLMEAVRGRSIAAINQGGNRAVPGLRAVLRIVAVGFVTALVIAHARAQAPAAVPEQMRFDIPYGASIDLDTADKAAIAEAKKRNWQMAVTVVGPAGLLVAHATMDGTQYASIDIAQAKARTAALFRQPSKAFADAINDGAPGGRSIVLMEHAAAVEGGVPIVVNGKLIGAIGASGGIATQDGVTAKAGPDAITPH